MRVAARAGLIAVAAAVCWGCQQDGLCTREALADGKLPSEIVPVVGKIDAGEVPDDLCGLAGENPGAVQIGGNQWTILFERGVLHCTRAGSCKLPPIAGIHMEVKGAESRLDVANVVLTPYRIGPLRADARVRYIAPNCTASPISSAPKVETADVAMPKRGGPMLRDPEIGCEPAYAGQWNMEDACVPSPAQGKRADSTVAVLDTGLDCLNPAIRERMVGSGELEPPRRCTRDSGTNYLYRGLPPDNCDRADEPKCTNMHGTWVAGIIASNEPGLFGVDQRAKLESMRILHDKVGFVAPWTTVATAILDSGKRSRIINISANWYANHPWLAAAIDTVTADGKHLIVASARSVKGRTAYPSAFTTCNAAVIGVAAIGRDLEGKDTTVPEWVHYSYGAESDREAAYMVAPGVNVPLLGDTAENGSSFAAPLVSGAASLIWSSKEFANCSAAGVREALECSARITIVNVGMPRKRLHLGCLFGQRDSQICRAAQRCLQSAKGQYCR